MSHHKLNSYLSSLDFQTTKKLCISTVYRVGTLEINNFYKIENHFESLALKKKFDKHILIGDMNFSDVIWPQGQTSCGLYKQFIDFFIGDLGHNQMISKSTHKSGGVLDLLFFNVPHLIDIIRILDQNEVCLSDHKAISFRVKLRCSQKKDHTPKIYDYSKANWRDLNFDIRQANIADKISNMDPHVAWPLLKSELLKLCDKHIPKKKLKSQFQHLWFDQECEKLYKEKEIW